MAFFWYSEGEYIAIIGPSGSTAATDESVGCLGARPAVNTGSTENVSEMDDDSWRAYVIGSRVFFQTFNLLARAARCV
jgi:hypothetical protein